MAGSISHHPRAIFFAALRFGATDAGGKGWMTVAAPILAEY
jgi:hypothetical protein